MTKNSPAAPLKIWVICQYYKPETGAPSARLSGFAQSWKEAGHNVTVLTAHPNHPKGELYPGYEGKPAYFTEEIEGIPVKRHSLYITRNEGFVKKTLSHLSFAWNVLRKNYLTPKAERPDVILVSSPAFFAVISAWLLARKFKVPFVFEVRDLWPGIFVELGVMKKGFILNALEWLELFLYRKAAAVVPVTQGFAEDITKRGTEASKVTAITNGVSDKELNEAESYVQSGAVEKLRNELKLNAHTKVILYIGTHGGSQALGQMVEAARLLMNRSDLLFLFVGDGADKPRLEKLAKGMPNVQFLPVQPKEKVWAFYGLAYASIVPLKDIPGFDTFIPSKMFEVMAAQTPVIGCVRGEAAQILAKSRGAIVVPPEQPEKLAQAVAALADSPQRAADMGKAGHAFVSEHYRHSVLAKRYEEVFLSVVGDKKR